MRNSSVEAMQDFGSLLRKPPVGLLVMFRLIPAPTSFVAFPCSVRPRRYILVTLHAALPTCERNEILTQRLTEHDIREPFGL